MKSFTDDELACIILRTLLDAGCGPGEGKTLQTLWQQSGLGSLNLVERGVQRAMEFKWVERRPDNSFVLLTSKGASENI